MGVAKVSGPGPPVALHQGCASYPKPSAGAGAITKVSLFPSPCSVSPVVPPAPLCRQSQTHPFLRAFALSTPLPDPRFSQLSSREKSFVFSFFPHPRKFFFSLQTFTILLYFSRIAFSTHNLATYFFVSLLLI